MAGIAGSQLGAAMNERATPPLPLEVASALLVPAASYGFVRLFADSDPMLAAIGSAIAATLLAAVLRRLRVPIVLSLIVGIAALGLVLSQRFAPDTQRWGFVPTGDTLDQLGTLLTLGADEYRKVRAPIESLDSFVAGVMIAAWLMAMLTDWAAMRLRLAFEPVLPAILIFGFSAVLGAGNDRLSSTIVFGGAVVVWAVAQRWSTLRDSFVWLVNDEKRGPQTALRSAAVIGAVALGAAVLVTPRLPGSDAEEIYSFRATTAPTRSPITPYVEISQRLVQQSSVALFTVETEVPHYWRVSGLETYDGAGSVWTTSTSFTKAEGDLDPLVESNESNQVLTYTVTIDGLTTGDVGEIWAPTVYSVAKVVDSSVDLSWNRDNATLTIDGDDSTSFGRGDFYTLESVVPTFTADQLRSATTDVPDDIAATYLTLPSDLTDRILTEASAVVAGQATPYDQALALQNYFRAFDYSTELTPRTSDPIGQFLDERVGFCQQFAGTYALMARAIGLPARVAIGYTWGDKVAGQENTYQVRGKHAHAWPEVWLGEYGWVAFEPTPNRGAPGSSSYTGVEPGQDGTQPTTADPADPATTPVTAAPIDPSQIDGPDIVPTQATPTAIPTSQPWKMPRWLLGLLGLGALYIVGMPLLRRLQIEIARSRADSPEKAVDLAWRETVDELNRSLDLQRQPAETRREFATRAAQDRRLEANDLDRLSELATMVRYDPGRATPEVAQSAVATRQAIVGRVHERVPLATRWRRQLDPRRWFR
ncbi:MAG: DUF3488 and transglutaminase-like domain-containing protein [Acidimicrobiales bacterium]